MRLVSIERGDGIVQTPLRVLVWMGRKRIVDAWRPAFFFEACQDQLLVRRQLLELFHYYIAKEECAGERSSRLSLKFLAAVG